MEERYTCPANGCNFSGSLDAVVNHIEETKTSQHSWAALGFADAAEFKRVSQAERGVSDQRGGLDPCPLTELYEAFRGVRTALLTAIRSEKSAVEEDDLSEPIVQYEKVLATFAGKTETESGEVLGYGAQHVERVDHKVAEYRDQFGNGEWIIDYQCTEVEPLSQNSRQTLSEHDLVDTPSLLVRPITPQTDIPVPELVMSREELSRALSILSRFPYRPPTNIGQTTTSSRFPIEKVYHAILADIDIEPVGIDTRKIKTHSRSPSSRTDTTPHWKSSPAALASPETDAEVNDFLTRYGKLTYLYQRIDPPEDTAVEEPVPVFALDFYDPISRTKEPSQHSYRILSFAKNGEDQFRSYFLNRARDFVYQRLLKDPVEYDYITVYPGHEAHSLSPSLVELAKQATVETPIVYSELLERVETAKKQSEQDAGSRWDVACEPDRTLQVRHQLTNDRVIVLDDVSTSGGSLAAAAHLLRKAGATEVIGLTLGLTRSRNAKHTREIKSREDRVSDIISEDK